MAGLCMYVYILICIHILPSFLWSTTKKAGYCLSPSDELDFGDSDKIWYMNGRTRIKKFVCDKGNKVC